MKSLIASAVFLVISIQGAAFGFEKAGRVDFTLEPKLSYEWVCYLQDGDLYVKKFGGAPVMARSTKEINTSIHSPDLQVAGDLILITWIEKSVSGKRVLFRASHDKGKSFGDATEISADTNSAYAMVFIDEKDYVYILDGVMGEKAVLHINLSVDKGKTFKRHPLEIKGLNAMHNLSPLVVKGSLFLFFSGLSDGKKVIGVSEIEINSMKMKITNILRETEGVSFIEALRIKDSPAFIYKTTREGIFVLEGFVKGNAGYEFFAIKDTEGLDIARIDHHAWGDGRIMLVFSGEQKGIFKQRIYAAVAEDIAQGWNVRRIDNKEFDNTRAWLPRMAVDGDRVLAVWEDSRDIRSGVRMKLSPDRGKTWRDSDIPMSDKKRFAFRPRISTASKDFYVAWHMFRDDEKKTADIVLTKLKWDDAMKMASKKERGINAKKKEAMLRERVNTYWKGMMKKDNKITYAIHDPFYRAKIPYDNYASRRSPMVYHAYGIEEITTEGNIATVKLKIKYDVPKLMILGKEKSIPMKEVVADDIYLFIDNIWYRKFVDVMSDGSAIDY